jgi:hypothetical protein
MRVGRWCYLNLLGKIFVLCDILTICCGLVHIPHLAITVSIWMVEITTSIEVTKPAIVTLTVTNTIVNPYLTNNSLPMTVIAIPPLQWRHCRLEKAA